MTKRDQEIADAAQEVRIYWRDWPQERRDAVTRLSSFLAAAIETLCETIEARPRVGDCPKCGKRVQLTPAGRLRQHNGDLVVRGWAQVCGGSGVPGGDRA